MLTLSFLLVFLLSPRDIAVAGEEEAFPKVDGFVLVNAATNAEIRPLNDKDVVDLRIVGRDLSVVAEITAGLQEFQFVELKLDGFRKTQDEYFVPYSLASDKNGNFHSVDVLAEPGSHVVTATILDGNLDALDSQSISFETVEVGAILNVMLIDETNDSLIHVVNDETVLDVEGSHILDKVFLRLETSGDEDSVKCWFASLELPFFFDAPPIYDFLLPSMISSGFHEIFCAAYDNHDNDIGSLSSTLYMTYISEAFMDSRSTPGPFRIDGSPRLYENDLAISGVEKMKWSEGDFQPHFYGSEFTVTFFGFEANTNVQVHLGMAENFWKNCEIGARIMNITVNGQDFQLDVYKRVGCYAALVVSKESIVNEMGEVFFHFIGVQENAMVSFIEVATVELPVGDEPFGVPSVEPSLIPSGVPSNSPSASPMLPLVLEPGRYNHGPSGALSGELKKWHKISLGFEGPATSETAVPNPFSHYRFDVSFNHPDSGKTYQVPGFYAADGNAANTGATSGNVWLVHFAPDEIGQWSWQASFKEGELVAQNGGGYSAGYFDGARGSFVVQQTNKTGRDHRGKGRLQYVGDHHLQFAETREWFLKAGLDSPENFLAYDEFDNTGNINGLRKSWAPHKQDFKVGDPTWMGGKGTGIIGALNYLAGKGMNSQSFIPNTLEGDDKNVSPYISSDPSDFQRIDVSKTSQWDIVFDHADHIGIFLHFKTQEHENDQLLDGGALGEERKLYYRELVARFGHHLALNWNLGEETTNTDAERKSFANFIRGIDPYNHLIVVHTYPDEKEVVYTPLLGFGAFDGISMQCRPKRVFQDTLKWVQESKATSRKWVVSVDEQNPFYAGVVPDADDPTHDLIRKEVLWGNLMAGGAGVEYYFGYKYPNSDLLCQDYRSRSNMWDQSRYALEFFKKFSIPFWTMSNANELLVDAGNNWCLANDHTIVVYLKEGGEAAISLPDRNSYSVYWYDPMLGGGLQETSTKTLTGGSAQSFGVSPSDDDTKDWVVLLHCSNCNE